MRSSFKKNSRKQSVVRHIKRTNKINYKERWRWKEFGDEERGEKEEGEKIK